MKRPSPPSPDKASDHTVSTDADLRSSLRARFKQRRGALSSDERTAANRLITEHLCNCATLSKSATIAGFAGTPTEVNLWEWVDAHLSAGGRVALPRVGDDASMEFYQFTSATPLENNRFGIAEPAAGSLHIPPEEIDAVLAPLVAFDADGHRLGMGGGYYDRYLPRLRAGTPFIGVAFACQQHEHRLPRAAWDIPLHAVVTENGVIEWKTP